MILERDGFTWHCDSFGPDDLQINKGPDLVAEWVKGKILFKNREISESDLMTVVELIQTFKKNVNKRV
jgi:hypothetical protein